MLRSWTFSRIQYVIIVQDFRVLVLGEVMVLASSTLSRWTSTLNIEMMFLFEETLQSHTPPFPSVNTSLH
jgi:hypothetical protein